MNIEYRFKLADGKIQTFQVALGRNYDRAQDTQPHAAWAELKYNQCENCPLHERLFRHCPAAADVESIAAKFSEVVSCDRVVVEVITPERTYLKECDAQTGLRSLLGLVMATSDCPILSTFRGLAHYHLPFASLDETVFRTVGSYLLKQYYIHKEGGIADLDLAGLKHLYHELMTVNRHFGTRLRAASQLDANLNAVVSLMFMSMAISDSIESQIQELRTKFCPY